MSYQALYRKFRPQDFDEVSGQEHIVTTLKNQLKSGRIGHAYVFSGTRGTGKTSIAKIFAKALNCEDLKDGNPCGTCPSCQRIAAGSSLNVFEVDGASNNGVDNIRTIIDDLTYPPVEGKYKVYIIDEAHMVTSQAFNAFLKTIEEPPEYAIFILATTEVNKIPITIQSRCQRYDFHRITVDLISARIQELCQAEGVVMEERAVRYIARLADGAMRDALSMLDQCISYYMGKEITFDMTLEMLGASNNDVFSELFRAICTYNAAEVLRLADEAIIKGMEPETFVSDLTWYLRNLLLVKSGEKLEDVADISTEEASRFMEEVELVDEAAVMRFITLLSELLADLKYAPLKRITLEVGLIRLCRPQLDEDYSSLLARIDMLEKGAPAVTASLPTAGNAPKATVPTRAEPRVAAAPVPEPEMEMPPWDEEPPWDEPSWEDARPAPRPAPRPEPRPEPKAVANPVSTPVSEPEVSGTHAASPASNPRPVSTGEGLEGSWSDFVGTVPAPDRPALNKAAVSSDSADHAIIAFEEGSMGARTYSKPENVTKLSNAVDSFMGYHINIEIQVVDADSMKSMGQRTGSGSMNVDEFLKSAQLIGVSIEEDEE